MDRFDDMRAKASKPKLQSKTATPNTSDITVVPDTGYDGLSQVTVNGDSNLTSDNIKSGVSIFGVNGSYGGGGGSGSTGYNVFVQQSEPESKDGVWIKSSGGNGETKFYEYVSTTGEFLEASNFNFLKTTENTVAQQIIDGYMYIIALNSTGSYKVNLKTQMKTTINTAALSTSFRSYGSIVYKNKIYIFGDLYNYKMYYCVYNPVTDTLSSAVEIGSTNKSWTNLPGCYEYDGKVLITWGEYNYPYYAIYDIENEKMIKSYASLISKNYGTSVLAGYGKYVYFFSGEYGGSKSLVQMDMNTYEQTWLDSSFKNRYYIFAKDSEYLYLFNASTSGSDEYYKYNLTTKTMETIKTQNKYYLYTTNYAINSSVSASDSIINSLMLDDKSGILYFRTSKGSAQPSAMQFTPAPELDELSTGTAVIVQSQYNNVVKMQDSSNIHTGIENAYLKTSDDLKSELTFLGNGEKWNLLSNPNGETATVTFNTNGGTSVDSLEVVIGQKLLTKPETTRSDNYIFDAWYLGSEPFDFNTQIIKDITLTAHWLEYEEVDYIESSGTQYVDTGILVSHTNRMELDIQYTDVNKYQINGARSDASGEGTRNDIGIDYKDSTYMLFWGISTTAIPNSNIAPDLERHTYFIDCISGEYGMDDEILGTGTPDETSSSINNIFLFARKKATSTIEGYCYERLFSAKIYTDGTLVRDFQPIKIETGTYALIDKVNNKAYFNAGTGSFTGGGYADT